MNDRQLLEAAATAAQNGAEWYAALGMCIGSGGQIPIPWNPLEDDGAAKRLAVKLRFQMTVSADGVHVEGLERDGVLPYAFEPEGNDLDCAARRAIVRAAAAMVAR